MKCWPIRRWNHFSRRMSNLCGAQSHLWIRMVMLRMNMSSMPFEWREVVMMHHLLVIELSLQLLILIRWQTKWLWPCAWIISVQRSGQRWPQKLHRITTVKSLSLSMMKLFQLPGSMNPLRQVTVAYQGTLPSRKARILLTSFRSVNCRPAHPSYRKLSLALPLEKRISINQWLPWL